jgi:hypothetical protein
MDYGTDFKFYNYLNLIDIEKIILFCNIYYWYLVIHCKAITIIIFFLLKNIGHYMQNISDFVKCVSKKLVNPKLSPFST